jgi:hypothetical protein
MQAQAIINGRQLQVLAALGIHWRQSSKHIRCPFPDHDDHNPSWRWDDASGKWFCTCGNGDVLDAVQRMRGVAFKAAVAFVEQVVGGTAAPAAAVAEKPAVKRGKQAPAAANGSAVATALPTRQQMRLADYGEPVQFWVYHNAARQIVEVRARYEYLNGGTERKKVVLPWTWNGKRWVNKAAPEPRPLYMLPLLLGEPQHTVLLVEGEKSADAAAELFPAYCVTTTAGGCKAAKGTDYAPLRERDVIIWPDNDEPGRKYAETVAALCKQASAASVRIVDVPQDWPAGWDLADTVPEGAEPDLGAYLEEAYLWPPSAGGKEGNTGTGSDHDSANGNVVQFPKRGKRSKPFRAKASAEQLEGFNKDEDSGWLYKDVDNVLIAIEKLDVQIGYDDFSHKYTVSGLDGYGNVLDDDALAELYLRIWRQFGLKLSKSETDLIVLAEARRRRSHPVKAYLNGIEWDGVERIDEWLSTYLGAENNDVNRAVGRAVLIAAVRRVRKPGCKFDPMMVLEGPQGCGKSSAIAALVPDPDWFTDSVTLQMDRKEVMEQTGGKWLVEFSELTGMRRADLEHVKALVSRQFDEARLSYARFSTRRPRQCVFIGTTNESQYLIDDTGNRRFLPVRVGTVDLAALVRDRDQLWGEAAHFEALGESLEFTADIREKLAVAQADREAHDEWEFVVRDWLNEHHPPPDLAYTGSALVPVVTMGLVAEGALKIEKGRLDAVSQKRLMRAMKKAGWYKAHASNGKNLWKRRENGDLVL